MLSLEVESKCQLHFVTETESVTITTMRQEVFSLTKKFVFGSLCLLPSINQSTSLEAKQHKKHRAQKLLLYFVTTLMDCELRELRSTCKGVLAGEGEKQGNRVGRLKIGTAFREDIFSA